jgi:hypothetical protein
LWSVSEQQSRGYSTCELMQKLPTGNRGLKDKKMPPVLDYLTLSLECCGEEANERTGQNAVWASRGQAFTNGNRWK